MALETFNALRLGYFSDLDKNVNNTKSENANKLKGETFGSANSPLYDSKDTVEFDDADNSDVIEEDQNTRETLTYDGGNSSSTLDSTLQYDVTLTYDDSSTATGTVTILQASDGELFLIGDDTTLLDDGAIESLTVNSVVEDDNPGFTVTPQADRTDFLCFTRGSRIATEAGETPVEDLAVGDLVRTADHGLQPVRWIGARRMWAAGKLAPVVFMPGAIGNTRKLVLSPQHRVLVGGASVQLNFALEEALVPAVALVNGDTIHRCASGEVEYFHIVCDNHELLFAEGARTESLLLGTQAAECLSAAQLEELQAIFPEKFAPDAPGPEDRPARPTLRFFEGQSIAGLPFAA